MRLNIAIFLVFIAPSFSFGVPHNLVKVKNEILQSEKNLEKLSQEKNNLELELKKIQQRVKVISDKKRALSFKLEELNEEIQIANYNLKDLESKQVDLRQANRARFVRAYKQWKLGRQAEVPKAINTSLSFHKKAYYYNKIQKLDRNILSVFVDNEIKLTDRKDELVKLLGDQDLIEESLIIEKKALNKTITKSEKVLKTINKKSKEYENELIELRGKALRFEIALKALIDESSANTMNLDENKGLADRDKIVSDKDNEFKGLNSKYIFPIEVKTKLKTDYGKEKVKNVNDYLHSKGVSVLLSDDSEVKAISNGTVVFVGNMPLYEKVIIIHHGNRDYSLYAKLEDIDVRKGDEVSAGDIIANDIEGSEFYLEIRKNNKHVNPRWYFKNWNDVVF